MSQAMIDKFQSRDEIVQFIEQQTATAVEKALPARVERRVPWVTAGPVGQDSAGYSVLKAAAFALGRLGVETIDLYYAHFDDASVPLEETVGAFGQLVTDGLVRHVAVSNYTAERIREWIEIADRLAPETPEVYFLQGVVYRDGMSDSTRAREAWQRFLAIAPPDSPQAQMVASWIEGLRPGGVRQ